MNKITPAERSKKWREDNPEAFRIQMRNWRRKNVINTSYGRVRCKKRLRVDDRCEICDKISSKLDYHHWDDDHPELGMWICHSCHMLAEYIEKDYHTRYLILKKLIVEGH